MLLLGRRLDGVRKGFLLPGVALRDAIEILVSLDELDSDMDDYMLTKATEATEQQAGKRGKLT